MVYAFGVVNRSSLPLFPSGSLPGGTAEFSPCETYRYRLTREIAGVAGGKVCNFVMLNPSTADAEANDATIRRCIAYCKAWGYARLVVTNLFALRSKDPALLRRAADPVGPENDRVLGTQALAADLVLCGWGAEGRLWKRGGVIRRALTVAGVPLFMLRLAANGEPCHPLYLPGHLTPQPWPPVG